jgi:hypothetical protein
MTMLLNTIIILNCFNDLITFVQQFGWQTGFFTLLLYNIYLTVAWVKREKHMQLVEIAFEGFTPKIKFELNKDEKSKGIVNENIRLKAENALLKKRGDNLPFIIIGFLLLAMILSWSKEKIGKPNRERKILDNFPESEKPKLLSNDKDPFDLTDLEKRIKDTKFDFDIKNKRKSNDNSNE